jgi:hypothetical protein
LTVQGMARRLEAAHRLDALRERSSVQGEIATRRQALKGLYVSASEHYANLLGAIDAIRAEGEALTQAQHRLAAIEEIVTGRRIVVGNFRMHPGLASLDEAALTWLKAEADAQEGKT